jgi:hypothetical protein
VRPSEIALLAPQAAAHPEARKSSLGERRLMAVTYERLCKITHHHYQPNYWAKLRALYAGGYHLLDDRKLLEQLMPIHAGEEDLVYDERLKRAFYIPYFGQLVDFICAALASDPVKIESNPKGDDTFYSAFFANCLKPGGKRLSVNQLLREQVLTALLCRRSWVLVDLPSVEKDDPEPKSAFEEEQLGRLDAYALPVEPESVIDWERDDAGELEWANLCQVERARPSIDADRNHVRETYTIYDRQGWQRFLVEYDVDKGPPDAKKEIPPAAAGPHSFGRVPLVGLRLPFGLWAGNKLESIAREHFNKRNALSWGEYRSLFQMLAVMLEPQHATSELTEDPDRAVRQPVGPGRVMVLAGNDKVQYLSPAAEPFRVAMEDLAVLRDEMHRVMHQMALSVDNSGAALQRSAKSKQVDQGSTAVVLRDLGRRAREHLQAIYEMVSLGRREKLDWSASGMDQFDEVSMDQFVTEASLVETISIPSQSFQADYKFELARRLVPGATDERLALYKSEIEKNTTAESVLPQAPPVIDDLPPEPGDDQVDQPPALDPKAVKKPKPPARGKRAAAP